MSDLLANLCFWEDEIPRDGALNMALDEVMLESARVPWLRIYRWDAPTVSIGFSQPVTVVPDQFRKYPVVRRWTGGGVVVHDGDWTYTLAIPRQDGAGGLTPGQTYQWIHASMISALTDAGIGNCELQNVSTSDGMGVCFVEPARHDVVRQGRKIAGHNEGIE